MSLPAREITQTSAIDRRIADIIKEARAVSEYPEVGVAHLACRLSFAEREIAGLKAAVEYLRDVKGGNHENA